MGGNVKCFVAGTDCHNYIECKLVHSNNACSVRNGTHVRKRYTVLMKALGEIAFHGIPRSDYYNPLS